MRSHAKASSAESISRQATGRIHLARLCATLAFAAAFFLIPAAGASAFTFNIDIEGIGLGASGTVEGVGLALPEETETEIECSGPPPTGTCEYSFGGLGITDVTAVPDPGSELVEWTTSGGIVVEDCGANAHCRVNALEEDATLTAVFGLENPSTLSVFKGGNGSGTVTSTPAGINCGTEPCQAIFEEGEEITLEASAESGSVFAGWLGCHPVAGEVEKCTVTLNDPLVDVTAVFLAQGPQGPTGPTGKTGPTGATGAQGAAGQNGKDGANGSNGAQGPAGPQGPQGPQGPAGKVTCKVKQKGKKVKVTCTVKASASSSRVRWRLVHGGKTYSHGLSKNGRLMLDLSNLRTGSYVLHVNGQKRGIRIVVH